MIPTALACSMCGDMIFRAQHWWAQAFTVILLVLLLDAVLVAIVARMKSRPAKASRALIVLPALAIPFVTTVIGLGTLIGFWVVVAIALLATARSIAANREDGRAVMAVRLGLVLAGVVTAFVHEAPSRKETEELVRVGTYVTRFGIRDGWIYDELRGREGGGLAEALKTTDETRLVGAVRMHANLGLPVRERAEACARLGEKKVVEKACEGDAAR